jgi:hypothetical protein
MGDTTVIVDLSNNTVIDEQGNAVGWDVFILAYAPVSALVGE